MQIKVDVFCGSKMRQARIINDMTLDDLAEETKIAKSNLWLFEKGVNLPTKQEEETIAKALDVLPGFFYLVDTAPLIESDFNFSPRMRRMKND